MTEMRHCRMFRRSCSSYEWSFGSSSDGDCYPPDPSGVCRRGVWGRSKSASVAGRCRGDRGGMDRYAVLVFHNQKITDEQQIAFSRNFGEIENSAGGNVTQPDEKRLHPLMNDVSNLGTDHRPLARDDPRRLFN